MTQKFSTSDLATCAYRECQRRRKEYPPRVGRGFMSLEASAREVAMMDQIYVEYRDRAKAEREGRSR